MGRRDALAAEVLFVALKVLRENGGTLDLNALRAGVAESASLTPWDEEVLPHGKPRWLSALERYSHEYVKAGFLSNTGGPGALPILASVCWMEPAVTLLLSHVPPMLSGVKAVARRLC